MRLNLSALFKIWTRKKWKNSPPSENSLKEFKLSIPINKATTLHPLLSKIALDSSPSETLPRKRESIPLWIRGSNRHHLQLIRDSSSIAIHQLSSRSIHQQSKKEGKLQVIFVVLWFKSKEQIQRISISWSKVKTSSKSKAPTESIDFQIFLKLSNNDIYSILPFDHTSSLITMQSSTIKTPLFSSQVVALSSTCPSLPPLFPSSTAGPSQSLCLLTHSFLPCTPSPQLCGSPRLAGTLSLDHQE